MAMACTIAVIRKYLVLPEPWSRLGDYFGAAGQTTRATLCWIRAKALLENVDKTVASFVKISNSQEQSRLTAKIAQYIGSTGMEYSTMQEAVTRDISHRQQGEQRSGTAAQFKDLGSSAVNKEKLNTVQALEEKKKPHHPPWLSNCDEAQAMIDTFMVNIE
jgi:hypothetical protein